jgi:shikimate dehydrogenase
MSIPKAFVAGHPIAHSRSPPIHGHWLEQHGLAGSYERIDVEPQNFDAFFRGFAENGFRGGNVTIPHKEAAFRLADAIVADIVYVPLETPLLRQARARGHRAVDGLGMLLHQAVPGFARWFGVTPTVTPALRALIAADIEGRR